MQHVWCVCLSVKVPSDLEPHAPLVDKTWVNRADTLKECKRKIAKLNANIRIVIQKDSRSI